MKPIEITRMMAGARPFDDGNVNQVWKAFVSNSEEEQIQAYVKYIDDYRTLFVECSCAMLAQALKLPVPDPLIVKIPGEDYPEVNNGEDSWGFGSTALEHPNISRLVKTRGQHILELQKKLQAFPKLLDCVVFDEWIANGDRNYSNVLYDGGRKFFFIDHDRALPEKLEFDKPVPRNQMAEVLLEAKLIEEKDRLLQQVSRNHLKAYRVLSLSQIPFFAQADDYELEEEQITEILSFLENRIESLIDLLTKRFGLPNDKLPA